MTELRLRKLPDRTPVKIAISLSPDLHRALQDYAEAYEAAYGQREAVADLLPFMIEVFLESDRGFTKAREAARKAGRGNG